MSALAHVAIHPSQFPDAVESDLLESLRSRKLNHKFHYDSWKQTQKWLALHQAYSPSRTDPRCEAMYHEAFSVSAQRLATGSVHVVGLGCGGGQKDTALLRQLLNSRRAVFYTPSDVSVAMVLVARQSALTALPESNCFPLVCDLSTTQELPGSLWQIPPETNQPARTGSTRLFTFFGMMPNFEPGTILPKLAGLLHSEDHLLLSANLAPGPSYGAGVERVLPLYDNELTREWLLTFLLDLGVERNDGKLRWVIEDQAVPLHLKRITAYFDFTRNRRLQVHSEQFEFQAGESFRLFFSYRHTPALVRAMLRPYDLHVLQEWMTPSEEEGVFLVVPGH